MIVYVCVYEKEREGEIHRNGKENSENECFAMTPVFCLITLTMLSKLTSLNAQDSHSGSWHTNYLDTCTVVPHLVIL